MGLSGLWLVSRWTLMCVCRRRQCRTRASYIASVNLPSTECWIGRTRCGTCLWSATSWFRLSTGDRVQLASGKIAWPDLLTVVILRLWPPSARSARCVTKQSHPDSFLVPQRATPTFMRLPSIHLASLDPRSDRVPLKPARTTLCTCKVNPHSLGNWHVLC